MKYAIAFAALVLGACSHNPEPAIEIRTVEVLKPVPVACVDESDIPAEPDMVGNELNGDAVHDADILGASNIALRQWGRELLALISPGCTNP